MKPRSSFIISIFLFLLATPFSTQAQDKNCRKISHAVEIKDAPNGKDGSITVSAKDSNVSFTLHLIGNVRGAKENQSGQTSTRTIGSIKPGKYQLIIHYEDASYCTETRDVTVN